MKPKLTTYQRLKVENQRMHQEMSILVRKPDSLEALEIKTKYKAIFDSEDVIWSNTNSSPWINLFKDGKYTT